MDSRFTKIIAVIAACSAFLLPCVSYAAIAAPWNATSTDKGYISPTAINGNLPGIIINAASSTFTNLLSGLVGNKNGSIYSFASSSLFGYTPLNPTRLLTINGTTKQLTSSAGAQDLSADRTWTLSLPSYVQFPGDFIATNATTTNATTTGNTYLTGITASRPLYVDSTGLITSGGTGTNGNCVKWLANNTFGDAGSACGSAGGASTDFTYTTNYGIAAAATSSNALWGQASIFGSSTSATVPALSASNTSGPAAVFGPGLVGISSTSPGFGLSVNNTDNLKTGYFYNPTPTTGKTQLTLRAGAGNLTTGTTDGVLQVLNSAGTLLMFVRADGVTGSQSFDTQDDSTAFFSQNNDSFSHPGLNFGMGSGLYWSGATQWWSGAKDLGLSRLAGGVLAVGNGVANNIGATVVASNLGLGTTTPFAQLSVIATSTNGVGAPRMLIAIASSTGGTATTTLFSLSNIGTLFVNSLATGFVQSTNGTLSSAALTSGQITTALGFTPFGGTNPLPVANGGTNDTSLTGDQILYTNHAGSQILSTASSTLFSPTTAGFVWAYENGAWGAFATSTVAGDGIGDPFTHPLSGLSATTSQMLIGTSTASNYQLTLATSSAPQLALSAGAGVAQWFLRAEPGGGLSIGTTTVAGNATTTQDALSISGSGPPIFSVGSSSPFATVSIFTGGDYASHAASTLFAIGSSTAGTATSTLVLVNSAGQVGIGTTSPTNQLEVSGTGYIHSKTASVFPILQVVNDNSNASQDTIFAQDFTNFAYAGNVLHAKINNSSDTGRGLFVENAGTGTTTQLLNTGTGKSFEIDDQANDTSPFIIDAAGLVGIGTTSPIAALVSVAASTTAGTTANGYSGTVAIIAGFENTVVKLFQVIDQWGHRITGGDVPVLTSCGTSPSFVGAANDNAMTIQVGSVAATGCTATFAHAWPAAPTCTLSNRSMSVVNALTYTVSTTAIVLSQTGLTSAIIDIQCTGTQ